MLKSEKRNYPAILAIAVIMLGIVLRLFVFFENRNLILDEANIARNLFERSFAELAQPLSYEQYAPPIFLWIQKLSVLLIGYSEYALRLYPLLAGIGALLVFYTLLKRLRITWLPLTYVLVLLATAHIFLRYSSEVKQYMPDIFIVLSLFLLSLRTDVTRHKPLRFFLVWFAAGSIAMWASMPSVFALAGIGCYYGWNALRAKDGTRFFWVMLVAFSWLAQFLVYYLLILKPQANSEYLQRFHQNDFLFATPGNKGEWMHNWEVFSSLIKQFQGKLPVVLTINVVFLLLGILHMLIRRTGEGLLFFVPVCCLLIAAALNQYSLMPRVALFSMPVFLILIAAGINVLASSKRAYINIPLALLLAYGATSSMLDSISKPRKYEQLTEGLAFLKEKGLPGGYLYVYHSSGPALQYYTTIHPERQKWTMYRDADILTWQVNYDSLAWQMQHIWKAETFGFIFTNATDEQREIRLKGLQNRLQEKEAFDHGSVYAYIFTK